LAAVTQAGGGRKEVTVLPDLAAGVGDWEPRNAIAVVAMCRRSPRQGWAGGGCCDGGLGSLSVCNAAWLPGPERQGGRSA